MMDGQATDPPQDTPGRRALGAMESAVRRARASAGEPRTAVAATRRPPPASPPADLPPPPTPPPAGGRPDRWLITSVAVAAVLVVAAVVALAVSLNTGGTPAPSAPSRAAPAPTSPGHAAHPPDTAGHGRAGTPAPSNPTSTTVPPAAGGPPVISTLSPSTGTAGQGIEVAGANFLSASGQIVATFNGQVAPTSCPAQNSCSVTVPPMSGGQSAQVVITTASGTSNALTFTYD